MKRNLFTAVSMTIVTTVLLGLVYPLLITALAQAFFREKANGQLVVSNGQPIGSRIIGQPFTGPGYFHSRPSAAGLSGYDATASAGSNLGPTNAKLIARVQSDVARLHKENPGVPVPADLITSSASGLDPDISPAAADFQVSRVAHERGISEDVLRKLVHERTEGRQWGFLGERRVNVLAINLELDAASAYHSGRKK